MSGLTDLTSSTSLVPASILDNSSNVPPPSIIDNKIGLLNINRQNKIDNLTGQNQEQNNSSNLSLEIPRQFDMNQENKDIVTQQLAIANRTSLTEAKTQVDSEALAYQTAKNNGYDLGAQMEEARQKGLIAPTTPVTSFDIYRLGDKAKTQQNINDLTGKDGSTNIQEGYALPGSTNYNEYENQAQANHTARSDGKGLYATDIGTKIMDSINSSSYANSKHIQEKYPVNSDISSALGSSFGKLGQMYGDAFMDGIFKTAASVANKSGESQHDTLKRLTKDTYFEDKLGRGTNFDGTDAYKNDNAWGYEQSQGLKDIGTNMIKAVKSGNAMDIASAFITPLFTEPHAIGEILASSAGEMTNNLMYSNPYTATIALAARTNQFLENRQEYTGKSTSDPKDIAIAGSMALAYDMINKITMGNAGLAFAKQTSKALSEGLSQVGLVSMRAVLGTIAKGDIKAYFGEGAEEVVQDFAQNVSNRLGTGYQSTLLDGNQNDIDSYIQSFGMGGLAGVAMHHGIEAPKELLQAYAHNRPLNNMIDNVNNLSADERGLMSADIENTLNVSNKNIENNKQTIDLVNSDHQVDLNNLDQVEQNQRIIDGSKSNINTLSNMVQGIKDFFTLNYKEDDDHSSDITEIDKQLSKYDGVVVETLDKNTNTLISLLKKAKILLSTNTDEQTDKTKNLTEFSNEFIHADAEVQHSINSITAKLGATEADDKTILNKLNDVLNDKVHRGQVAESLTKINSNAESANNLLKFKQDEINKVNESTNSNNSRQSVKSEVNDTFSASKLLEHPIFKKFNSITNMVQHLQQFDTKSLEALKQDLVNIKGQKNANKLASAVHEILRTRYKAQNNSGFKTQKSASETFDEHIKNGLDGVTALIKAVRVPSLTQDEATSFNTILDQLVQQGSDRLTESAITNIRNRINSIVKDTPINEATPSTEPSTATSTTNINDLVSQEDNNTNNSTIDIDTRIDMYLDGFEITETTPEQIKQSLEASGAMATMQQFCK